MKKLLINVLSLMLIIVLCVASVAGTGLVAANAVTGTVYLRGTFNDWEALEKYVMRNDGNNHYVLKINLDAGTYKYKAATGDWSYNVPYEDATLTLENSTDVTFVLDGGSNTIEAYPATPYRATQEISRVIFRCKWMEHSDQILTLRNNRVAYRSAAGGSYEDADYWNIIPDGHGAYMIQSDLSKEYMTLKDGGIYCTSDGIESGAGRWYIDISTNNKRFTNVTDTTAVINTENQTGYAEACSVPIYYTSGQWGVEYSTYDYTMHTDGISDTGYNVIADTPDTITSYATGKAKKWTLSRDLSGQPGFSAPNTPLAAAVYNLTMEETLKSINTDSYGQVFYTGTEWQKVWTRDTAMACMYSLSWIFPEISYNCQREKIKTADGISVFEEDTGSGGSYPVSTDKIITMLAVWETYLTDGNRDHLKYFYDICENTIMQDMNVCYDKESGLFRGETSGTDWRDQTYPDWTSETVNNGLNNIAESKSASVNVYYVRVLEIMSRAAEILGKDEATSNRWAEMAARLEEKVSQRLWNDNLGLYSAWEYPEYMGSVKAEKADVLGNGYALWFNVGTQEQLGQIAQNYPLVNYGAPTVYPQKMGTLANAQKYYHNRGVWPGWQTALMIGANYSGNEAVAKEIFNSNVRGAATSLTNKEVINYQTGEGICSDQQLWSIAGTLAGYYRVLFGMNYDEKGVSFDPAIPDWMQGPFTLENYKYRDAVLSITVNGSGDNMAELKVDGEAVSRDYIFPAGASGRHTIEITMEDGAQTDMVNKGDKNLVICPSMPKLEYQSGSLFWTPESGLSYKLWDGKKYIDVTGMSSYRIDASVYGCYCLMSVSEQGIASELSKPVVISPDRIRVEAESGKVSSQSVIKNTVAGYSGSGYVQDRKTFSAKLEITVDIPKDGTYLMSAIYNNTGDATSGTSCAIRSVYVDGKDEGSLYFPEVYSGHNYQLSTHLRLELTKGVHTVKVFYDTENFYDRNMNIQGNNVELDCFNFDLISYTGQEPVSESTAPSSAAPTEPTAPESTQGSTPAQETTESAETRETEPAFIKGDANSDGRLDINDVTYIQKYLASYQGYDCSAEVCDANGDGRISISDATLIQKYMLGMVTAIK